MKINKILLKLAKLSLSSLAKLRKLWEPCPINPSTTPAYIVTAVGPYQIYRSVPGGAIFFLNKEIRRKAT